MAAVTKSRQKRPEKAVNTLGARVRELRRKAGLSQTSLAGGRFSKEYVSQIERGKTRPNLDTLTWLAERLGVDTAYLEHGVSVDERSRVETMLARGEAQNEARRYGEAASEFARARAMLSAAIPDLELRALAGEGWARARDGELRESLELLSRAREISELSRFSDLDRADVLFRLGVCRYMLSSMQTATSLFDQALELAEKPGLPCDRLRADILQWRSACYRRRRDWEAAREDIERSLELARGLDDVRATADAYFHASLIAERTGHWVLARSYAERAKREYERVEDRRNVGRLLNNLGAFNFELGKPDEAVKSFKAAFGIFLDFEDAGADAAHAVASLARVHLETGEIKLAEEQARKALELLDDRADFLNEVGGAQLVLGRALMEQGRLDEAEEWLLAADRSYEQLSSPGHLSAALMARGDLATRRGDTISAARLYRNAAELLQDVRF
jgi:tetratricopeptide (TPR) repeat protein